MAIGHKAKNKPSDVVRLVGTLVPLLICLDSATAVQAASKHHSSMGWSVEQKCQTEGQLSLLLSDSGFKLSVPKQNIVVVAKAPTWSVVMFNKKENLGREMPLHFFVLGGFRLFGREKGSKIISRTNVDWNGQPGDLVVTRLTASDPLKEKVEMLYQASEGRSAEVKSEKFLFEKWMNLPAELRQLLAGLYRVEKSYGLLLERTSVYSSGRQDVVLKTISCTRIPVSPMQFEYPKGYKPVDTIRKLTMDKRKQEQAAGLLEDILIGD